MWPSAWSKVPQIDSTPLWHELGLGNVDNKTIDVNFYTSDKWGKVFIVEAMEPTSVLKEATKFPKQGFLNGTFDKWVHKVIF
jgi:hypothetical protein